MANDEDFAALGIEPALAACLTDLGYEAPTPIQQRAIPAMLAGGDLLCQAATGTGKTAAFALPILHRRAGYPTDKGSLPTALILTPTRELCMQVAEAIHRYGRPYAVRTLPVFGGQPIGRQVAALKRGVDVVVATPGRAIDLIERRYLKLTDIDTVVLDEADEMLDMGFAEDIETILTSVPDDRQTVMFSATMPKRIVKIAEQHMQSPERIEIPRAEVPEGERPSITQIAYIVPRPYKAAALGRILDTEMPTASIVFCRTRADVDNLTEMLNARGYRAEALHGGMDQKQRDRVMTRLRNGSTELLVATDVAARGLDVDLLTHVFNYDVPAAPESYVHRTGRVGRGGRQGVAITIADPREGRQLSAIERSTKQKIRIGSLPSSDDLRERRLEVTRSALEQVCRDSDLDRYRGVLGSLTDEFDLERVALAAIKSAHLSAVGEAGEEDIPEATVGESVGRKHKGERFDRGSGRDRDRNRDRDRGKDRDRDRDKGDRRKKRDKAGKSDGLTARLHISLGKEAGVRPKDIVGAIANETSLSGKDVGSIDIAPRFVTVDVPANAAKEVIEALGHTRIQGRRVKVRFDRKQQR